MARKNTKAVAVDSVRHKDKRKNIPTEELCARSSPLLDEEPSFRPAGNRQDRHQGDQPLRR